MIDIPPVLRAKANASVMINGLLIPLDDIKLSLDRFTRPLLFHNEGSDYSVSAVGSCMLARYRGENLLVATRHQLGKREQQRSETEACIAIYDEASDGKPTLLTPSGSIAAHFEKPEDKFREDILVLSFERGEKTPQLSTHFLQLDKVLTVTQVDQSRVLGYLTVAYPSSGIEPILTPDGMKYAEFKTGFVRLALEPARVPTEDDHVAFCVRESVQRSRNFDGYSGAPVYFCYVDEQEQAQLGWVGIIRLAGEGVLHVHLAEEIKRNYLSAGRST